MAGNYMDDPALRVSYDRDGSIGAFFTSAGLMEQLTATELRTLNGEAETGVALASQSTVAIIFPAPMDIVAVFFATNTSNTFILETSTDTTTGIDGTWIAHTAAVNALRDVKPNYRVLSQLYTTLPGAPSEAIRGVRMRGGDQSSTVKAFHIYADYASTATPDRLAFWHPTLDQELPPAYLDWGNVPRSSSADKSFRIKNLSGDLTASDIGVYMDALTPGSPSVTGMHTLSDNGGSTFLSTLSIAELLPGAISSELIVRRTVPSNAPVSVWSARVAADVTTWS